MSTIITEDFLLNNSPARMLYHGYAKNLPIIDYHSHLSPADIANDRKFSNLTQAWLEGDHYKWRAMRANGIHEKYITGNVSDQEKFEKWADTIPFTLRNPLFHWTHLELNRYFGITDYLGPDTAIEIYEKTQDQLQSDTYSCRHLLKKMNVELICTTDDPIDSLDFHRTLNEVTNDFKVLPTFRADKVLAVQNPDLFNQYLNRLEEVSGHNIGSFGHLITALRKRQEYFDQHGCKLSDHGINYFYADEYSNSDIEKFFNQLRTGKVLEYRKQSQLISALLFELAVMDHDQGWVQQFHYGALRNTNSKMFNELGADAGYDSIGSANTTEAMRKFFDKLEENTKLAKTIVYNLNPADNEVVASMMGNFQDGSVAGKMQFGSAWWFLDQKDGIERQLNVLSNLGLLSRFVGMLTDSRSFLSFPRHEYFRRILCNLLGADIENGFIPDDIDLVGTMVSNICYSNAKKYFDF